ncbi:MAG: T9SS C-terminal target domain-containing protein [Bacteroidetes bacterium]|nr:MAG: T9SS C-terminal target domain-containing protein [Bacteroidota bacterium]
MKTRRFTLKSLAGIAFLVLFSNFTFAQIPMICPDDGFAGDEFGVFVSVSGDYALVGASAAQVEGTVCGAAYVFKHESGNWTQQAKFVPDIPDNDDMFGKILKLDGDYALVAAYNDDDMGSNAGAAYIYKRTDDTWAFQNKIYAADAAAFDIFGVAADIKGDRAIIGAFGDDDNGFFSGSAYVFIRQGDQWIQEAKLLPSDGATDDKFGRSVAIDDDLAVVCGVLDDDNGEDSGSVYIFRRNGSSWTEEAKITPDDGASNDRFGRSISIAGDYVAISAAQKDENGMDGSGSAYVFKYQGGQWIQQSKLVPDDLGEGDLMGYCISSNEEFVAISAHLNDEWASDAGAVYLFQRNGDQWSETAKLTAENPGEMDHFGISVDISENTLVVGAPLDQSDDEVECGVAYVYDLQEYVSTQEVDVDELTVFPNPARNFIYVKTDEMLTGSVLSVYAADGKLVVERILNGNKLDVSGLASGNYFFELKTLDTVRSGRFVVE